MKALFFFFFLTEDFSQGSYKTTSPVMAARTLEKKETLRRLAKSLANIQETEIEKVRIENCIGYCKVPLGIAGPLHLVGPTFDEDHVYAPLATYEPTVIASCCRGCKALNKSGGVRFEIFDNGMSRAPVFVFKDPRDAITFAKALPTIQKSFAEWAQSTSTHVRLQRIKPTVIGSQVHLFCSYDCGSATGQNMVTKATQYACDKLQDLWKEKFSIRGFLIEGQLASDKIPSWGNVKTARGVETLA